MKSLSSFQELDAPGEGLSRDYTKKTHRWNALCFDVEGFITDYLGLSICYESFAEKDSSKIGFLANGIDPLLVHRGCGAVSVVFPKDTIVIYKCARAAAGASHWLMKLRTRFWNGTSPCRPSPVFTAILTLKTCIPAKI